jgi:hypothetical protein
MRRNFDKNIPTTFLNNSKLIVTATITILTIADLAYAITYDGITAPVHFYTPAIKIATFVSILFALFYFAKIDDDLFRQIWA